ncbi:MAG: DivIVA domain-containing protein [bacterium]
MKITPQDIYKHEFKPAMRGYDKDEVDAFLEMIASQMEELIRENAGLKDELKELKVRAEEFEKRERALEETLLTAKRISEQMKENSQKEAELIVSEAKRRGEEIIAEATEQVKAVKSALTTLKLQKDQYISQFKAIIEHHWKTLHQLIEGETKEDKE